MKEEISELTRRVIQVHQEVEGPGSTDLPRYLAASDLHGNHWRFQEILETARRESIAKIFLLGDIYFGSDGWSLYRLLRLLVDAADPPQQVVPLWGNHELAFVAGMLGHDSQLRFCFGFGGRQFLQEINGEQAGDQQSEVSVAEREFPTDEDLAEMRGSPQLQEMVRWIQETHRLFTTDIYGTGYLHACPRITRDGRVEVQYQTRKGLEALKLMESDLAQVKAADHPIFSVLLQTDTSPLWGLFEISSAKQFDGAYRPLGIRQLIFGHRHRTHPVNIAGVNRQIGIAVDFEDGLGGYLLIGPDGLLFRSFVETGSHRTEETALTVPKGRLTARQTHLLDVEEFLVRRIIDVEKVFVPQLEPESP